MSDAPSASPVAFSRPSLGTEEEEAVLAVLRSGWLTTGEVTAMFEKEFAQAVGTRHALALNSGTAGLHLSLEALGVGPGSVVLTTPYTFTATAEVVRYLGADPVFVDIDRATLNIDVAQLEAPGKRWRRRAGRCRPSSPCTWPVFPATWRRSAPCRSSTASPWSRMPLTRSPCGGAGGTPAPSATRASTHSTRTRPSRPVKAAWWPPIATRWPPASASCGCTGSTARSGTATRRRARAGSTTWWRPATSTT